jgi:hypothetical protein
MIELVLTVDLLSSCWRPVLLVSTTQTVYYTGHDEVRVLQDAYSFLPLLILRVKEKFVYLKGFELLSLGFWTI